MENQIEERLLGFISVTPTKIEPDLSPLYPDRSLAVSSLQKSIRRGQCAHALSAAAFVLKSDPERFWRRLCVIAIEDVGIGDLEAAEFALWVAGKTAWRRDHGGDWLLGSALVSRLCSAPKSRDACDLLVIADLHPTLKDHREEHWLTDRENLAQTIKNENQRLSLRVLAAWYFAGTRKFPGAFLRHRPGSFVDLIDLYRSMGVGEQTLSVAHLGASRMREGHPVTLPLVSLIAGVNVSALPTDAELVSPEPLIHGWPAYAFDIHTRFGREVLGRFIQMQPDLRARITAQVPEHEVLNVFGNLTFRAEGQNVDRRIVFPGSAEILREADEAQVSYCGLPPSEAREIISMARVALPVLHDCRIEILRGYAGG